MKNKQVTQNTIADTIDLTDIMPSTPSISLIPSISKPSSNIPPISKETELRKF